jgi:hypothetical protein
MEKGDILAIGFTACVGFFVGCFMIYAAYKKFKKWWKPDQNLSIV